MDLLSHLIIQVARNLVSFCDTCRSTWSPDSLRPSPQYQNFPASTVLDWCRVWGSGVFASFDKWVVVKELKLNSDTIFFTIYPDYANVN